ncbi:MAG TPA: DUF1905 domain-containing protein [Propionibacteriaceae bacterium]|nr:DUF1905 domain-containing protein [Propionibacteriaceae bacterium]
MIVSFSGEVFVAPGEAAWHFVRVPPDPSEEIRLASGPPVAFGSVKVEATVGRSVWSTSVFPESRDAYVLPLKKSIRAAEGILEGDTVDVSLRLI